MEVLLRNSRVPDNNVFEQIQSPMAISVAQGLYDHYVVVCDALANFAKCQDIIPYDQTLGGRYVEYLLSFSEFPEDSLESRTAVSAIMDIWELFDDLCDINMAAAEGRYITPVVRRNDDGAVRAGVSSFATGIAKDCLVAMFPVVEGVIADLCGKDASVLDTFTRLGQEFSTYVNVELDSRTSNASFLTNKRKFEIENADCGQIICMHSEVNDFIRQQEGVDRYFSVHSLYHVEHQLITDLAKKKFSGVAHFSDLLFLDSDVETDNTASLIRDADKLNGTFGVCPVRHEPLRFSDDVGWVYPLRFLNNTRATMQFSTIASKTLAMWSTDFSTSNRRIAAFPGVEYKLRPVSFNKKFRRAKIYDLDAIDFYFLRRMGYYISAKIDGLCGFISTEGGIYYLSLRDGRQFQIFDLGGRAVNLGKIDHTVNVEVIFNPNTHNFQFWFVGYSPPYYPTGKAEKRYYWKKIFTSWAAQVEKAKMTHAGLFFKSYLWVERDAVDPISFDVCKSLRLGDFNVPIDGVTLHDPYGNFVGFWKPWKTADVRVDQSESVCYTFINSKRYTVIDKKCRFIHSGIYEVYVDDGEIILLQPRLEKEKSSELVLASEPDIFQHDFESVQIGNVKVKMHFHDFQTYITNYGGNYIAALSDLAPLKMDADSLKLTFEMTYNHLKKKYVSYQGNYLVSDWVASITAMTTYPVSHLWSAFVANKYCRTGPYSPLILSCNNVFRAFVSFS